MTYLGSKSKYSKYIVPILQKAIDDNKVNTFIDCCVGGSNIIKEIKATNRIGIDNNQYLIALMREMQKPDFKFPKKPTREDWDKAKKYDGSLPDWYIGLISIFSSYNTRGFAGGFIHGEIGEKQYNGRVNTAKKDIPKILDIKYLCYDYHCLQNFKNCVIYIDPPYFGTKKYDTSKDFNHNDFWEIVRKVSKKNIVFVSEMTAPEDFEIVWEMETKRTLGSKTTKAVERLYRYKT